MPKYFLARNATTREVAQFRIEADQSPQVILARRVDTRQALSFLPKSGLSLHPQGWTVVVKDTSKFGENHTEAVDAYRSGCKGCMG